VDIHLTLDQRRFDYIVNVLAQRPYAEVAETLQNLAQQAQASQMPPQAHVMGDEVPAKPNGATKEAVQ